MEMHAPRKLEDDILESIEYNPITAIIGPRQSGKTHLAQRICESAKIHSTLTCKMKMTSQRYETASRRQISLKDIWTD
jgi:predicted AAA+ superfamily ATPase